jgi:hypothetical protein
MEKQNRLAATRHSFSHFTIRREKSLISSRRFSTLSPQ